MKIRQLTPSEKEMWDPTGKIRNVVAQRSTKSKFAPPSDFIRETPDKLWERYQEVLSRIECVMKKHHKPYFDYNRSLYGKVGPQGGAFDRQQMLAKLQPYFDNALRTVHVHPILRMGADYLVDTIRHVKARVGGVPYFTPSFERTFAGSPTGLHKGDFLAESVSANPFRHAYPTVMGQRRMRGKDRLIFMDSVLNVRIMESWLAPARNWLKRYLPNYFGSWLNPCEEVHPRTQRIAERASCIVESDYEQMDASFGWTIVEEVVLPVYRELLSEYWTPFLEGHLFECFHQPVFGIIPDTIIEGKHNLLSGIGCTNDFETIYTVCLAIGVSLYYGCLDHADILALGDDMRVGLYKCTERFGTYWLDTFREVSAEAGLFVHDVESGKSWVGARSCRYLRRVYYEGSKYHSSLGLQTGAYPSALVFNNIVQPEFPEAKPGLAAIADLQRLDNMFTNPEYNEVLGFFVKHLKHKFIFSPEDVAERKTDWWEKLYGERWDPASSPTYNQLQKFLPANKK
jgi:hypothetical protein